MKTRHTLPYTSMGLSMVIVSVLSMGGVLLAIALQQPELAKACASFSMLLAILSCRFIDREVFGPKTMKKGHQEGLSSHGQQALLALEADVRRNANGLVSIPQSDKRGATLKEQLLAIHPQLEELRKKKEELRKKKEEHLKQFAEVKKQIQKILIEIAGSPELGDAACFATSVDEDLSQGILEEYHVHLQALEKEQLQDLGASLIELWNLMDSPVEEQNDYQHITNADAEVQRLDMLRATKMELVIKKQTELDNIHMEAHMKLDPDVTHEKIMAIIDSGLIELLANFDRQIATAKEEALRRKEIMEKMDKWISACEEETWLEDYNRDENGYNASRGEHINLKRAEKAQITVEKLPSMIENLIQKTKAWEEEHSSTFLYDGLRLLDVLEEHNLVRKEKEQGTRRMRDQKNLKEQMVTEQEALFGSSQASKCQEGDECSRQWQCNSKSASFSWMGTAAAGCAKKEWGDPCMHREKEKTRPCAPVNYISIAKEDSLLL